MPVRLIMNNKTLTVLEGTDYDNLIVSYNLKDTKFYENPKDKKCWGIIEENPKLEKPKDLIFCPFGVRSSPEEWKNEWMYDFNLFKNQCYSEKELADNNSGEGEIDDAELNKKMDQAKADLLREKEKELQREAETQERKLTEKKVNMMELEAIKKEFNIEELIEKEEAAREEAAELKLEVELDKEKEKRDCLMKKIKEKQLENQYNAMKLEKNMEIEEQKNNVKKDIVNKRQDLAKKLKEMRARSDRKLRRMKQKLKQMRSSMGDDMSDAYRKSQYQCSFKKGDDIYCKARFTTNPEKYGECINSIENNQRWCEICCTAEIGSMFMDDRKKCLSACASNPVAPSIMQDRWFAALKIDDENSLLNDKTDISKFSSTNESSLLNKPI